MRAGLRSKTIEYRLLYRPQAVTLELTVTILLKLGGSLPDVSNNRGWSSLNVSDEYRGLSTNQPIADGAE